MKQILNFLGLDAALDGVATQPVISASPLGPRRGRCAARPDPLHPVHDRAKPQIWQLRELKLALACGPLDCELFLEPVSAKTNRSARCSTNLSP